MSEPVFGVKATCPRRVRHRTGTVLERWLLYTVYYIEQALHPNGGYWYSSPITYLPHSACGYGGALVRGPVIHVFSSYYIAYNIPAVTAFGATNCVYSRLSCKRHEVAYFRNSEVVRRGGAHHSRVLPIIVQQQEARCCRLLLPARNRTRVAA